MFWGPFHVCLAQRPVVLAAAARVPALSLPAITCGNVTDSTVGVHVVAGRRIRAVTVPRAGVVPITPGARTFGSAHGFSVAARSAMTLPQDEGIRLWAAEMLDDGRRVSEKTIADSMRSQGLVAHGIKQDKTAPKFPDLLRRDITAQRPNPRWWAT